MLITVNTIHARLCDISLTDADWLAAGPLSVELADSGLAASQRVPVIAGVGGPRARSACGGNDTTVCWGGQSWTPDSCKRIIVEKDKIE